MRIPGTRRARLIVGLSMAALIALIGVRIAAHIRTLYHNLGPLVVAEIQRQLDREVAIGRLDVSHPGRVVLERVAVAENKRLADGVLFRAPRVVIKYAWLDLLWMRSDLVGSVRRIEVDQPYLLLIRERDGRLNVQKLFKPRPGAPPTRFRAQVVMTNGRVLFRDYKTAFAPRVAENEVGGVNANLDYGYYPRITAQASGAVERGRAGVLRANTLIDTARGGWLIQAFASDADAAYWARFLARVPMVRVQNGRGNVDLVVSRDNGKAPIEFVANLALAGVSARVSRLNAPIRGARGFAQITPYGVKMDATASLGSMPVRVNGNILDWKKPQVALSVRGSGITVATIRRLVPRMSAIPGLEVAVPGQVDAWILGPASHLYATGTVTAPLAAWRGEQIQDARVAWRYHAGMLQLDHVTATAARGGQLQATGWAQLVPGPPNLYVTGKLAGVNLAGLPGVSPRTKLGGKADLQFAVSGPPKDLHGGATVQLSRLFFNTARLDAATAHLDYQDGVVYVRALQASDPRGRLAAAGTVSSKGDLKLQVRAGGINLAAVLAPFTKAPASGTAYLVGQVGGTVRDPRLEGDLQVYAGKIGAVGADYAEGRVILHTDRVETERLALRIYPGEVTLRGTAGGWREGRTRLDLQASLRDLSVARLLSMANLKLQAAGSLSGSLRVQGEPARIASRAGGGGALLATGDLRVDDMLAAGTSLGTATARLQASGGRLQIVQASIDGEALAATAHGSIGLVAGEPGAGSSGERRVRVGVGVRVGTERGSPTPTPTPTPTLARAPAAPASPAWLVGKDSPLNLDFAIQKLDLASAAHRAAAKVLLSGKLQATEGRVSGSVGAPVVTARAEAAPLQVNGVTFTRLAGLLGYEPGRAYVRDTELAEEGGFARIKQAAVHIEPGKPMSGLTVDASVEAFPIQRLIEVARNSASVGGETGRPLGRTAGFQEVTGPLSGTITARPAPSSPGTAGGRPEETLWSVAFSAPTVTLPGYRLAPETGTTGAADSQPLSVGLEARATYHTEGWISLERVAITRDDGLLQAQGTVILEKGRDATGKEWPRGQLQKLRLDATDIPVGLFGPLAPVLHPLKGVGELHLDAEGPLRTPTIDGSVDVENVALGGVPFSHFAIAHVQLKAPPPEEGSGSIRVENARLEVVDKEHPAGQHLLRVDGTVPFRWLGGEQGMAVRGTIPTNEKLSLAVQLPEQSLDVLTAFSKLDPKDVNPHVAPVLGLLRNLTAVSGTMAADLAVGGTRALLDTSGSFRITDGAFQPQQGQTRFEKIGVRLAFSGNRIDVQQLEGVSKDGGSFTGSGTITGLAAGVGDQAPAAKLDLKLALNDLRYTERNLTGYLGERFRGTLSTVDPRRTEQPAPLRLAGDWRAPTLTGGVLLRKARLELPGTFPEVQQAQLIPLVNPALQLDLILGKDVWLVNPRMRMELSGPLPIRGKVTEPNVTGRLLVDRGQMSFPTALFRVEGAVEVAYSPATPAGSTAPLRVDLTATSRIRGTDPNTGQRQRYDVTLVIRGPLTAEAYEPGNAIEASNRPSRERLTIESRSDPPLSEQQILALIGRQSTVESVIKGGGDVGDVLRNEVEDTLLYSVVPTLFTPIETVIEDFLGLDEFTVDFALREPVQVRIGKQIYGPFYATYTRSLNAFGNSNPAGSLNSGTTTALPQNLYTLELYYKLSNRFRLGYRFEEPSHNRVLSVSTTFRF